MGYWTYRQEMFAVQLGLWGYINVGGEHFLCDTSEHCFVSGFGFNTPKYLHSD